MKNILRKALILGTPLLLLAGCASTPGKPDPKQPVVKVADDASGTKKTYQTQDGKVVQYEIVNDAAGAKVHSYKLGAGDSLEILVPDVGNDAVIPYPYADDRERFAGIEFTRYRVMIDPVGNINIPLAGEVEAADLSVGELEECLKHKLEEYLVDARIIVKPVSFASYSISIMGEVNRPGRYEVKKPVTLSEAIALGGGINRDGSMNRVIIGRRGQKSRSMNVTEVWANGSLDQEVVLERDDVVFVTPKLWITMTEMEQLSTIISNFSNVIHTWK